jgi:FKBP-type peptidyl-prolyl cis-trans isomerase
MRSFFVLLFLGICLLTIALVVRSGILARKHPGQPINAAMRIAMEGSAISGDDEAIIEQRYPNFRRYPSGLMYILRLPGKGPTPQKGSRLTVNYEGHLLNGTKFDSSYDRGHPFRFTLGVGEVIKGWDEGFAEMHKGEKRTLIVPYWLGYGDSQQGKIPPRSTLVFDVELVDFD